MTERISVDSAEGQANGGSGGVAVRGQSNGGGWGAAISADGRFVAFTSLASNLVIADGNFAFDVFVRDRLTGTTERVSVDSLGTEANGHSGASVAISEDGRFVAFDSVATNLVSDDTNRVSDVFVHDRSTGITERVSTGAGGQANGVFEFGSALGSGHSGVAMSADGRFVAFDSYAANLVAGDTNHDGDIFVRDRQAETTERVNVDSAENESFDFAFLGSAASPAISADGRFVAFVSQAPDLVANDTAGFDVFVRDRAAGTTERVSLGAAGAQANRDSGAFDASVTLSADGRFIAFTSLASNLVADDTNEVVDVFVRDRLEGATERVSLDSAGGQANSSSFTPAISADGRFVAFGSSASNLVAGDIAFGDVFVRDRQTNTTELASVDTAGSAGQSDSGGPAISADGRFVAFHSSAPNLVAGDTNSVFDIFVRDRGAFADTEPPLLTVPDAITVDAESPAGAAVVFAASATDNVDPDVAVTCTPASGTIFPVGTTTVSCSATDDAGNTASATFDVVVLPFIVPFAAFDAKVEIEELNQLELKATFRLGGRSDGIDPTAEDVSLRVGLFEVTIAAGSFVVNDKGRFRFEGVVDGIYLEAQIRVLKEGGFEFKAEVPAVTVASIGIQVEVSLTIGDDTGTTTAAVEIE